ncbi:hypothetical protein ACA910_008971 [Epithemia clementina (nom. ined.)]
MGNSNNVNENTNNNNNNKPPQLSSLPQGDDTATREDIVSDLERVEQQLARYQGAGGSSELAGASTENHPGAIMPAGSDHGGDVSGGRAFYESISSALASIRRRLPMLRSQESPNSHPSSLSGSNGSPAASVSLNAAAGVATAIAATSPENNNYNNNTSTEVLEERLDIAERAHSRRIPLNLVRSEMERRSQPAVANPENSSLRKTSSGSLKDDERYSRQGGPKRDDDNDDYDKETSSNADSTLASPSSRSRRTSTLMASRSRLEALQRPAIDRELHGGGVEVVLLTALPEIDGEGQEEPASANNSPIKIGNDNVVVRDEGEATEVAESRMEIDSKRTTEKKEEEDQHNPDVTLLITDSSRHRLDESSSSAISLLESHQKASLSFATAADGPTTQMEQQSEQEPWHMKSPKSDTVVYSWGLEGSHSLHDTNTVRTPDIADSQIVDGRVTRHTLLQVSLGPRHTAAVSTTGQVLICGDNSQGQVDPYSNGADAPNNVIVKPRLFEFPSSVTRITQISCGNGHTAAVTASGTVLTWGDNTFGQLGHRQRKSGSGCSIPTAMTGVSRAAQVSCGFEFTTVLTTRMQLFVCGSQDVVLWNDKNAYKNQIESANIDKNNAEPPLPATVPALEGLPLVKVVAGARHVVVLTAFGTAYAWGANEEGCCSRAFPKSIHTPVPIIFAADNMDTSSGFGDGGNSNQLNDILSPFPHWRRKGPEDRLSLDPAVAIQDAACGEAFTILLTKTRQVYVCGSNGQGQLGLEELSVLTATFLRAGSSSARITSVAAGQCHSLLLDENGDVWSMGLNQKLHICLRDKGVRKVYAGGKESVAIAPASQTTSIPGNNKIEHEFSLQKGMDEMMVDSTHAGDDGEMFVVEKLMALKDRGRLLKRIHDFFSSPTIWNSLFLDPPECDDLYKELLSGRDGNDESSGTVAIAKAMQEAMLEGLENLRSARHLYPESVRFLLLFLQCPLFLNHKVSDRDIAYEFDARGDLALALCDSFLNLPFEGYKAIQQWAASVYGPKYFSKYLVRPLIAMLERGLADGGGAKSRPVTGIVTLLRWFNGIRQRNPSLATPEDFYSEAIGKMNPEVLYDDLKKWKDGGKRSGTFFLSANPFLLSPRTKRTLLMIENQVEMLRAATSDLTWDREHHQFVFDPYFVLAIDRQNLLPQTLQKISAASHVELRKSLKIVFKGEDAVDAGGVTKEFFQLLSNQLFDMNTGMWSSHFGDTITWFNGDCTWNDDGYYLVGVLTGLAIYNAVILDVHFPRVVYRKLLGHTLGLEDMVDEDTKKGLQTLLSYDGDDVEDVFCLSFEHTWMDLGMQRRVELKPGGADIPVTSSNREEYVMLYVKWLLVDSVQAQYDSFARGVMQVLESSSLDLLEPDEMELLLVGTPELDLDAWEKNTSYEGFEPDSPVIRNFWKFIRCSDRETQLKLLKFTTGASRAPIGGLGAMPFKIQRAGGDSMQLPTSHTCFNILILPDYGESYEKLERLVGRAILECEGFGLQ